MSKERLRPSEQLYAIRFRAVTISGRSGTGKTAAIEGLARKLGLSEYSFFKIGEFFRQKIQEATGQEIVGDVPRGIDIDRQLDAIQKSLLRKADNNTPIILEGRLAGVIAREIEKETSQPEQLPVIKILFTARDNIRLQRILKRQTKHDPALTLEEIKISTREREMEDLKRWQELHPWLISADPFDPNFKDENGKLVYDLVVNTDEMGVEEVEDYLIQKFLEKGAVR